MDADLQDDPDEIPRFVQTLDAGYDLVSGWKKDRHDPLSKTLPSRLFNKVTARISGVHLHDFNCGFKAYRREIFDSVELYGELHRYVPVLAHALGYRVAEIPGTPPRPPLRQIQVRRGALSARLSRSSDRRDDHAISPIGRGISSAASARFSCWAAARSLAYLTGLKLLTGASIGGRPLLLFGVMVVIIGIQLVMFGMLAELSSAARSGRWRRTTGGAAPGPQARMRRLLSAVLALAASPQFVCGFC